MTEIIAVVPSGHYVTMSNEKDSSFAKEVNKKQSEYWVSTGHRRNIEESMWEVLIEDYNNRHKSKPE